MHVLKPPFDEQLRVIDEIGRQARDLDLALAHTVRQVSLLHEFRTCLIADVVTGKLDVREAASSLPDLAPLALGDSLHESLKRILESNSNELDPALT